MLLLPASAPRLSLPSESPAPVSRQDPTAARIPPRPRRGGQPRRCFSSSPSPGRQTGGRAGAGEPAQPRRGGGRGRKGRARSRLHGPAAGCVTQNRGLTLLRPPHPRPPEEARRGRAGPPRPLTSGRSKAAPSCCTELPPQALAAPAAAPRENRRCRADPAALTGAFRGAGGEESRRGTHPPAGGLCPGPSPSLAGRDPAGSRAKR